MQKTQDITWDMVDKIIPKRNANSDKNAFGRVLLVCGSVGYTGAAYFAAQAAVRAGSGVVTLAVPQSIWQVLAVKLQEAVVIPLPEDESGCVCMEACDTLLPLAERADAVLIGCGLGRGREVSAVVRHLVASCDAQIVLDADGINAMAAHIHELKHVGKPVLVTPHAREFERLFGQAPPEDDALAKLAVAHHCHILCKAHRTRIALANGAVFRNTTGNPGMAKGGSGDVLAGMLVSLCGQGIPADKAACAGAFLHGKAGDAAANRLSEYGMTPSDMLLELPHVFKRYNTKEW